MNTIIQKAKLTLMLDQSLVFYTTILLSLKVVVTECISTCGVDGISLYINPVFFKKITESERVGVLLHEVMHIAFDHILRSCDKDKMLWNIAGDFVINNFILSAGYTLPTGALYDDAYKNMTTDDVYASLLKESEETQKQLKDTLQDFSDIVEPDNKDISESHISSIEEQITETIVRAKSQAETMMSGIGELPIEVQIQLQKRINPKLPWHIIFRRCLYEITRSDWSYQKPNKKFIPDYYLPTLYNKSTLNVTVFVDSSSSVTIQDFQSFITEINYIQKRLNVPKIEVISFTTKLGKKQILTKKDDPFTTLSFTNRGGTKIAPVMEYIDENKPKIAVIFTDGKFNPYVLKTKTTKLFWIINNNDTFKSDYGKVINYVIKNKSY